MANPNLIVPPPNPWSIQVPPFAPTVDGQTYPLWPYTIPARWMQRDEDPQPHCNWNQVRRYLLGIDLSLLGNVESQNDFINQVIIAVSGEVSQEMRCAYDWQYRVDMVDGSGSDTLMLPQRAPWDVLQCIIRILPSNTWYHFVRPRVTDGTEFVKSLLTGIAVPDPYPPGASSAPGDVINLILAQMSTSSSMYPTGIEDTDLIVDRRRRTIKIPPRVLYANLSTPMWNYNFIPANFANVEIHATYGYPPTNYMDGSTLVFNAPGTGSTSYMVQPLSTGNAPIDWSSGMPTALTNAVAKLVANRILRQTWRATSQGLSSLSVDGGSESYGTSPFGGDLDKEDERLVRTLVGKYAVQMVV